MFTRATGGALATEADKPTQSQVPPELGCRSLSACCWESFIHPCLAAWPAVSALSASCNGKTRTAADQLRGPARRVRAQPSWRGNRRRRSQAFHPFLLMKPSRRASNSTPFRESPVDTCRHVVISAGIAMQLPAVLDIVAGTIMEALLGASTRNSSKIC